MVLKIKAFVEANSSGDMSKQCGDPNRLVMRHDDGSMCSGR